MEEEEAEVPEESFTSTKEFKVKKQLHALKSGETSDSSDPLLMNPVKLVILLNQVTTTTTGEPSITVLNTIGLV